MSSVPSSHRDIDLERGKLVDQIKNKKQKDWKVVCERLGLHVSVSNGKGSHIAAYKAVDCLPEDKTCIVLTMPSSIYPNFQRDLLKKLVFYGVVSGIYTEDDVWRAFGFKIKSPPVED